MVKILLVINFSYYKWRRTINRSCIAWRSDLRDILSQCARKNVSYFKSYHWWAGSGVARGWEWPGVEGVRMTWTSRIIKSVSPQNSATNYCEKEKQKIDLYRLRVNLPTPHCHLIRQCLHSYVGSASTFTVKALPASGRTGLLYSDACPMYHPLFI